MENYYVEKQTEGESGIYIIVNIMDAKAYVGKATDLSNRTHKQDLRRRFDNQNLQADYDKGVKLVYFKLFYDPKKANAYLFNYEKFYMTLVEDYGGFELYNSNENPKKENRTEEELRKLTYNDYTFDSLLSDAKVHIDKDFQCRFDMTMQEIVQANRTERQNALNKYWEKRILFTNETPYFSKDYLSKTYDMKAISLKELNPDRMLVTTAGVYLNESLYDILDYETKAIQEYGYCLWTFGRKINTQFGRAFCSNWVQNSGKDIYLLIRYTSSGDKSEVTSFRHFNRTDFNRLSAEEQRLLLGKDGDACELLIPENINATGTKNASHGFIIEEFCYLKEHFDFEEFKKLFWAVSKSSSYAVGIYPNMNRPKAVLSDATASLNGHHDTSCLCMKDDCNLSSLLHKEIENPNRDNIAGYTNYIVAKLKAPYIVDITK